MNLKDILELAAQRGASDVHLKVGLVPVIRKHGKLRPLSQELPVIKNDSLEKALSELLTERQKKEFLDNKELDFGYGVTGVGRFRVHVFMQRGSMRVVARLVSDKVPDLAKLGLPQVIRRLADLERGLVLVTGITGSGKTTTLASLINEINITKNKHILTIEDPIEFLIRDRKSIVSQREVGHDTMSFSRALRAGLRQDPDVILIGEMRDKETIEIALTAAETGHLVFSTLHTLDAQETINRILSVFEQYQFDQIRRQLAGVLKAVISQRLCRRADGGGFVPAAEILIVNQRVRDTILDPARSQILRQVIEESRDSVGMQTFDQSLMDLVKSKTITMEEALRSATNPEDFQLHMGGVATGGVQWQSESHKEGAPPPADDPDNPTWWTSPSNLQLEENASEPLDMSATRMHVVSPTPPHPAPSAAKKTGTGR